ncbi:MAG: hypothetical protein NZ959_09455 [Armatimonadetes bacterium]|nr:hypothetical protein [Armatimonadota bacterium]MDW8122187.1 hypothetical protein [Armatimonadota bacterium]
MPREKCAITTCNREEDVRNMYWCPNCKLWLCSQHARFDFWRSKRYCPSCDKEIPKK